MAKKQTRKSKAQVTHSEPETYTYPVKPEKSALTAREKKAIIEKEVFCRECKADDKRVLAAKCNDDGVPLCWVHGGK